MRRQWKIKKMDHPNLAIDISHGWINGVVELYLLVLIWLLFNIHAFASGGWPWGKGFALLPGFPGDSVSQSRSWSRGTENEATCLREFTQKWKEHCNRLKFIPTPLGWRVALRQKGTLRRLVNLWSSEVFLGNPYQFFASWWQERGGLECVLFLCFRRFFLCRANSLWVRYFLSFQHFVFLN